MKVIRLNNYYSRFLYMIKRMVDNIEENEYNKRKQGM